MKDRPTVEEIHAAIDEWYEQHQGKRSFKKYIKEKFSQYNQSILIQQLHIANTTYKEK